MCLLAVSFSSTEAQDADLEKAAKVKAAFLYNFIKFVEWPSDRSPALTNKATICIAGNNPFGNALNTLKSQLSGKLELTVIDKASQDNLPQCHVLFVGNGATDSIKELINESQTNYVLSVSESSDFADKGGVIEMKTVEKSIGLFSSNKINLRINIRAAEHAGLKINPQLLEIAAEVLK